MNYQKNDNKQFLCLNEKHTTWIISSGILLLCVVMICSYIVGYRTAIRNIVDAATKESFSDQLYTSVIESTLSGHQGYYIQCKVPDKNTAQNIIDLSNKKGLCMSLMNNVTSLVHEKNDEKESFLLLVSPVIWSEEKINDFETFLKNEANIQQYDIITVHKTQKLKGYVS
jgi:hypothetical protein